MTAYVVVNEIVEDDAKFNIYREKVLAIIQEFGGRFVARGGNLQIVEGGLPYPRLVIIEFPTREAVDAFYNSPQYQEILPFRLQSSKGNFAVVDGV